MTSAISVAMNSALSGLQVNQTALGVTSSNISNAGTEGYTRKIAELSTRLVAGEGAGVEVAQITRQVSEFLLRDLRNQHSALGAAETLNSYYRDMQDLFGQPGSSSSIGATMTKLANAFQALSVEPESSAAQQDAINAALAVTRQLNTMTQTIQELRMTANREIDTLVDRANSLISNISELNAEISRGTALNKPVGDLQDQRDRDVAELASIMDIRYFTRDTGEMVVFAGNGRTLVDTLSSTMTYAAASSMSADVSYPGSGIDGISVNGTDITASITSGKLKSLVDLRDTILPNLNTQLDNLATTMRDEIDAIHNDGAAVPPPNTLTGTTVFSNTSTDSADITGVARIGVVDANGNIVGTPIDLDFDDLATVVGGTPTVDDVIDAINGVHAGATPAIPGLSGATASVSGGRLVISADNAAYGIAVNEGTSQESSTGFAFSHFFGLNDFFTGSSAGGVARNITVRSDLVSDPQLLARGELTEATLASGDVAVGLGDGSVSQRIFAKFNESLSFSQAGGLPQTSTSLSGYGAAIVSHNANLASTATSDYEYREVIFNDVQSRTTSESGVNIDEELSNLILYQNAYQANARMINTLSEVLKTLSELV